MWRGRWAETWQLQSTGVTVISGLLPCDLASKWQSCPSLGYGRRANDTLRGLTWLLAHCEQQELTGTQFCHYAPRRPLIREAETLGEARAQRGNTQESRPGRDVRGISAVCTRPSVTPTSKYMWPHCNSLHVKTLMLKNYGRQFYGCNLYLLSSEQLITFNWFLD